MEKTKSVIRWQMKLKQFQQSLNNLNDYLRLHPALPPEVESAISIKQDILIDDIQTLRQRIRKHGRNDDGHLPEA